ncbi:T9SS type A sorting domain-containing protein, partial [Flavobacteriales bacterium]|nr:T9SS type A sorting domain-containing protein [Flavobacteriales bacterium]
SVGVFEQANFRVSIYPNPVKDNVVIDVMSNDNFNEDYNLKLLDSRGRIIEEHTFKKQLKINRNNIARGIYVFFVSTKNESFQQKIIFE